LKPFLLQYAQGAKDKEELVDAFLLRCTYYAGAYEEAAFQGLATKLSEEESQQSVPNPAAVNRLFYFAIPPVAFLTSAQCINSVCMSDSGFTRLIIEKPFGHDLASAEKLTGDLGAIFTEDYIYRIDHYLGKEIIQNAQMFRFGNSFLEPILNHHYVANVRITVKENFGTEGRGGYFTNNGIIRDFMQNHLMQVLTVFAMEPPPTFIGVEAGTTIRNQKVNVIKCMDPISPDQVVCGQYVAANGKPGYLEDDSIAAEDRDKANYCPTFAQAILYVNNARWQGVPFIMKAGKALDERKAEIRVQFKDSPAGGFMFGAQLPRNELVMRLQPDETIYMKVNVKEPGLSYQPVESELDLSYATRYADSYRPDAYIRLILDSLRGNQSSFVRSDELLESWKLWTPLLEHLEAPATRKLPEKYAYNSRGPALADDMAKKAGGFLYDAKYQWSKK
jgi:glucose-6-phosphate 1-dehydrogenase